MKSRSMLILCVSAACIVARADRLDVVGLNVESGDADPKVVAQSVIAKIPECDIWGLSEVQDGSWAAIFEKAAEKAAGKDFTPLLGTTGGADKLMILYREDRLELVLHGELLRIQLDGRAPLVAHFRDKLSGREFLFIMNHFHRRNKAARHEQARLLNEWVRKHKLPVVAIGDYNFDWDVETGEHDKGYDLLTADDVLTWLRPARLVTTQCSNAGSKQYNSVLDFVFVTGGKRSWNGTSEIRLHEQLPCPDDKTHSDHRPVLGALWLAPPKLDRAPPPGVSAAAHIRKAVNDINNEAMNIQVQGRGLSHWEISRLETIRKATALLDQALTLLGPGTRDAAEAELPYEFPAVPDEEPQRDKDKP